MTKIGLKLPHSLTLCLNATATALSEQNVILNNFVILCEIEDASETLDINFYNDIITIFQDNIPEKVLTISLRCPEFSALKELIKYQNGPHTILDIVNKNVLLPVTKKNTIIDFNTKLNADCFYYSTDGDFKNITSLNGKISLKEIPFFLNAYKLPTPSSLSQIPSTTRVILSQSCPLPSSYHIIHHLLYILQYLVQHI